MPSKPIQPLVLDSIGIYGLNRQASPSSLEHKWLTTANNIMLDDRGRISTRKGIKQISINITDHATANTLRIKSLGEFKVSINLHSEIQANILIVVEKQKEDKS